MSAHPFPIKAAAVAVSFAMAAIGWQLAAPSAPVETAVSPPVKSRGDRTERRPRISPAEEFAKQRMRSLRAADGREARMLATIALAESLAPAEFSDWLENGWFNLRGGPEFAIFTNILTKRWRAEEPEGYVAWVAKKGLAEADEIISDWLTKDPQRALAYFKTHPDDVAEMRMLAKLSTTSQDLALQRLREMAAARHPALKNGQAREWITALAEKAPAALAAMLDSLPTEIRRIAETQWATEGLKASFSEEIRKLWQRPDGWKIYSECARSPEIASKLISELQNLPPEWRRQIGLNPTYAISDAEATQWLDADLAGAGFSTAEIQNIQSRALEYLAGRDPTAAIERLGALDLGAGRREEVIQYAFSSGDPVKLRALVDQLPTEEERQFGKFLLGLRTDRDPNGEDPWSNLGVSGTQSPYAWNADTLASMTATFRALPDDRKRQTAALMSDEPRFQVLPTDLQSEAIRCLIAPPGPPDQTSGSKSPAAKSSEFAVRLMEEDPVAATRWAETLPAGEARNWTIKNLIDNWKQYDPKAAAVWETSLPAADRASLNHLR